MSANYPAAAFVIMMVTTVLLVPSSAAPTYHGSTSGSDINIADSWWYNACGHHSIHHQHNKNRNRSDMQVYKIVKNQMKVFDALLNREIQHVKKMCSGVEHFDKIERKSFDFLPKYTKPTNRNRSKTALKEFHADLQYYVVIINYLQKLKVHSNANFNWTERNEAFVEVFHNIKSLICEVEAGVNITGLTIDSRVTPDYPIQRGLQTEFDNVTKMCLHDTGVMYKLGDFIRRWKNNLMKRLPTTTKRESESEDETTDEETVVEPDDDEENSIIE